MNKLFACLAVFSLLMIQGVPVFADQHELDVYGENLSTYPVTDAARIGAAIQKVVRIHHIIITNSDADKAQTVTFYSLGDSTTTVTSEFAVDIASTGATGYVEPIQISFPIAASHWSVDDLLIRKSSVHSDVRVTIFYH